MDLYLILPLVVLMAYHFLKVRDQRRRVVLLGAHLNQFRIEPLMESVMQGYERALGENSAERREQVWRYLEPQEQDLSREFARFSEAFSKVWNGQTQASTLSFAFPYADRVFPRKAFDLRDLMVVHAHGIATVATNQVGRNLREKAYALSAELLLMQHSCHWFCRSRNVASARMMVRHQVSQMQLLEAVTPETRVAYERITGVQAS
jgi:hypothetical protein